MSSIEWTNETWNPITGCTKVSEGCAHCYAEGIAKRLWGDRKFGDVQFHPERLEHPLKWRKPRMVFVNLMSDLFHEDVAFEVIASIFGVMAITPQHTYQILTKRPYRMLEFFNWLRFSTIDPWTECHFQALQRDAKHEPIHRYDSKPTYHWPLPNVWLGVTCEIQRTADERRAPMQEISDMGWFTWVSHEPALEQVDFAGWEFIKWMVMGGESGHNAHSYDLAWPPAVLDWCRGSDVAFFHKQLGHRPYLDGALYHCSGKGNIPDEWPEDLRVREFPAICQPLKITSIAKS